jgi:hypothetical protein
MAKTMLRIRTRIPSLLGKKRIHLFAKLLIELVALDPQYLQFGIDIGHRSHRTTRDVR